MTSAYFLLILREYGKTARDRARLLRGTRVSERQVARRVAEVTLGQQLRQIRNANRWLEPGWALAMGSRFHVATHGAVGFATVSAPTLAESLEVMTRFGRVRSPHFRLRASSTGKEVRLVVEELIDLGEDERRVLVDLVLLSAQGLVESVLGRPMAEARFDLSYRAPDLAGRYGEYFHGPVRFGAREAAIAIPSSWLRLECPLADPVMYEASLRTLESGERRLLGKTSFAARVEQLIAAREEAPAAETVARLLRVSRRTLARRLREAGTSYRRLVETSQKLRAAALLADRHLDVAEAAYALGYEDAANFGRACRRWFGMSPGRYRARLLARG